MHAAVRVAEHYRARESTSRHFVYLYDSDGYLRCEIELRATDARGSRWHARYFWILSNTLCDGADFPSGSSCDDVTSQVASELAAESLAVFQPIALH